MMLVLTSPLTAYFGLVAKCYRDLTKPFSAYPTRPSRTAPMPTGIGYAKWIDSSSQAVFCSTYKLSNGNSVRFRALL